MRRSFSFWETLDEGCESEIEVSFHILNVFVLILLAD